MNYGYKLKWEYTIGTLRNFDPRKNYYIFQPKDSPERPLMVPLEALEPCEEYHTYHLEGSLTNRAFSNRFQYNNERKATDLEEINITRAKEDCKSFDYGNKHQQTRSLTC